MHESVSPASTVYRVDLEAVPGRVAAVIDGQTVAESSRVVKVLETRLPPALHFPRADVDGAILRRSERRTFCPFKVTAASARSSRCRARPNRRR